MLTSYAGTQAPKILIVDDCARDRELLALAIEQSEFGNRLHFAGTAAEFASQLELGPDVILTDYAIPGFGALEVLRMVRRQHLDIPVIVVSGTVGDEAAVQTMRVGAVDFVSKDCLRSLKPAIRRALKMRALHRAKRAAEERVRQYAASLAAAQKVAHFGNWEIELHDPTNLERIRPQWSDELYQILGYGKSHVQPSTAAFMQRVHADDRQHVQRLWGELVQRGTNYSVNYRLVRPDGTEREVEETAEFVVGSPHPRLIGTVQDLTRQRRAEAGRRESEERFTRMFRSSPAAMVYSEGDRGTIVDANGRWLELTGYAYEEVIGRTGSELSLWVNPAERAAVLAQSTPGGAHEVECRLRRKNGEIRVVLISVEVLKVGRTTARVWMMVDITERKKNDEALRLQSRVLESMSEGVHAADENGIIVFSNPACDAMFGYPRGSLLGRHVSLLNDLPEPASHLLVADVYTELRQSGNWAGEIANRKRDGSVFQTRARISSVAIADRQLAVSVHSDITETRQLEAQLHRAQRMESVGRLAAGIAHDMNNILAPILMATSLLRSGLDAQAMARFLTTIEASAQRGAHLVKQLLLFGRGLEAHRTQLHLGKIISEVEDLLLTFPKNIVLATDLEPDVSPVCADPTQMHQVLLNLCVNARDAMPQGGRLSIALHNHTLNPKESAQIPGTKPGSYVVLTVRDTGGGIPPEHLDKIFDPFFTTKELGKGTGLGLSTVLGIVKAHGGAVTCQSGIGQGTAFALYFPVKPEECAPPVVSGGTLPPAGRNEMILLADDEENIREIVRETLVLHGYRVVTAGDGEEAAALFAQHAHEIKLVITDYDMPLMNGPALVKAIGSIVPGMKVIVSSGIQSSRSERDEDFLSFVSATLPKPYTAPQVLNLVHRLLAGSSDARVG